MSPLDNSQNFMLKVQCAAIATLAAIISLPLFMQCKHVETVTEVVKEATCTEEGKTATKCVKCDYTTSYGTIAKKEHAFGDYELVSLPQTDIQGVKQRACTGCDLVETENFDCNHAVYQTNLIHAPQCDAVGLREVECLLCNDIDYVIVDKTPHEKTKPVIVKEPTCYSEGVEHLICVRCDGIAAVNPIDMIECDWGDWEISEYATPFEPGHRSHTCNVCGKEADEDYEITMGKNMIYIPSSGILAKFAVSTFTQGAVDSNDIVYTNRAYGAYDEDNPFCLGHWFGSLRPMYKTPVGAYIYVCVDGRIDTYVVKNSEYAVETNSTYHIGQETGVNVFDAYGSDLKSSVAVFGVAHKGEDLDPEKNDGRTLHMYTCHYGKDKPGWNSKHGSRGRWIILADMIDSVVLEPAEET